MYHRAWAPRGTSIAVAIALLKACLHNGNTVLNSRTKHLFVVILAAIVIVVYIAIGVSVVEDLTGKDLPSWRFVGL